MFDFFSKKKVVDVYPFVRRISERSNPNQPRAEDARSESRYLRTFPLLVCPWEEELDPKKCKMAVSNDISDRGMSLVLNRPFEVQTAVIGVWIYGDDMPEPWFFRAEPRNCVPIGGGFWRVGFEFREFMNQNYSSQLEPLMPLAQELLPPVGVGA